MKFRYLIIIFLIGFFLKSHAKLELNVSKWNDAAALAQSLPKLLIKNGIERIGNLNLNELVQKINDNKEITFISIFDLNNNIFLGGKWLNQTNGFERIGAECYTSEATKNYFSDPIKQIGSRRLVNINKLSPLFQNLDRYYLQFTLLHESLCSLYGFSIDDQYQITSSIAFILGLLNKPDEINKYLLENKWNFLDPFRNIKLSSNQPNLKRLNQKNRRPAEGGGVTVGTGGGDPWSAYFKFILMSILHGKEIYCNTKKNPHENVLGFSNLPCKEFTDRMQRYWDKLRLLNIETEISPLFITVLDKEIQLSPYRITDNAYSSISLVINRAFLNEIELAFKDATPLTRTKQHLFFISNAFSQLITQWNNGK